MDDLTFNILKVVVSIVVALISVYLIPYLRNKLKEDKYAQLLEIIEIAVRAAEQTIKGEKQGTIKKSEVISFVNAWMNEHGMNIDEQQISQLIESAVFEMNRYQ